MVLLLYPGALLLSLHLVAPTNGHSYRFAVVAKDLENVFFQDVGRGCQQRARELTSQSILAADNVTCVFAGSPTGDKRYRQGNQTAIVEDLLENDRLDGMAFVPIDPDEGTRLIQKSLSRGIPTITYNVDAPLSGRMAYIGADTKAFGVELANTLLQSQPTGGEYVIVDRESTVIKEVASGVRERLTNEGSWSEATGSPLNCEGKGDVAHRLVYDAIGKAPGLGAVISCGSYPVRDEHMGGWKELVKDKRFSNVTFIVVTERDSAISLFKEGYINSLVGVQPFMYGVESIDRLYELSLARNDPGANIFPNGTEFKAPLISCLSVDAYLQETEEDMNHLGSLVILGHISFGMIAFFSVVFFGITTKYRSSKVVKASQPPFLQMITVGSLVCSSTIVPLGFDSEKYSLNACSTACTVAPWLFVTGFNIVVSALYAKTRRINTVMKSAMRFKKVAVTVRDVLKPFAVTMLTSTSVLVCWTVLNPAVYSINASSGTDNWNRSYKSFYGSCNRGGESTPYVITLLIILTGSVLTSIVEAYKARHIQTEYQESKYIAATMFCMLQAFALATPLLFLLQEKPQARYVVLVLSIFMVQSSTLLLIFVPKCAELRASLKNRHSATTGTSNDVSGGLKIFRYQLGRLPNVDPTNNESN